MRCECPEALCRHAGSWSPPRSFDGTTLPCRSTLKVMVRPRACLVDVFDTILTCDLEALQTELAGAAGVPVDTWSRAFAEHSPALVDGRLSMAKAIERLLQDCHVEPRFDLVAELVRKDQELLIAFSRLYEDSIPFLQTLRSRGIMIAFISNCTEGTRALLNELGVSPFADSVALSCEVGCGKPSAHIYQHALDQLGTTADAALLIDDQPSYCAGAVALGMNAVQIARGDRRRRAPEVSSRVVRSLLQVEAML